jgi:chaperone required for assembly of F1-ATPase
MAKRAEDFSKDQKAAASASSSSKAKGKPVSLATLQTNVLLQYSAVAALLKTRSSELQAMKKKAKSKFHYLNGDHFESLKVVAGELADLKKGAGDVLVYVFEPTAELTNTQTAAVAAVLGAAERFLNVIDGILSSSEPTDWMGIVEFLELHLLAGGTVPGLCITTAGDEVHKGLTKGSIKKA